MNVSFDPSLAKYFLSDVYIVASTNTDIPNYYTRWFLERVRDGFVELPTYRDPARSVRVSLAPEDVKGFIFYSKNYRPFFESFDVVRRWPVKFFFTIGDSAVFQSRVPQFPELFAQVDELIASFGHQALVWKLPPLMFDDAGSLLHVENLPRVATAMSERGIDRCLIELFSADFHPEEIKRRLTMHGVAHWSEASSPGRSESLATLMTELQDRYGIQALDQDYRLFSDLQISDIENRLGVFDIGRMGMACPTRCLYCDTNFTVNYDEHGKRRRALSMDHSGQACGLESYLSSTGLSVASPSERDQSPYMVELRTRFQVDEATEVVINVIGDEPNHARAYLSIPSHH